MLAVLNDVSSRNNNNESNQSQATKTNNTRGQAKQRSSPPTLTLPSKRDPKRSASDFSCMAAQTVFSIIDHLQKWQRHRLSVLMSKDSRSKSSGSSSGSGSSQNRKNDAAFNRLVQFLKRIPKETLARASFACGAYTRALLYYELHLKEKLEKLKIEQKAKPLGEQVEVKPEKSDLDFLQVLPQFGYIFSQPLLFPHVLRVELA